MAPATNPDLFVIDSKYELSYQPFSGLLFHNGVNYLDVKQGALGDCYLMAALAEISQHAPSSIAELIRETGTSGTTYNTLFSGRSIEIDNQLPVFSWGSPVFADFNFKQTESDTSRSEGWVALLEKSYAIANSSPGLQGPGKAFDGSNAYKSIEGGRPEQAVVDLVGGTHSFAFVSDLSDADIHSLLQNNSRPTFIGTRGTGKSKKSVSKTTGLAGNHAYSVIGFNESNGTYRVFNPWNADGTDSEGRIGRFVDLKISDIREAVDDISWVNLPSSNLWGGSNQVTGTLKAPGDILIYGIPAEIKSKDGLSLDQIWASDPNGWQDINFVKVWLEKDSGQTFDLGVVKLVSPFEANTTWGKASPLSLSSDSLQSRSIQSGHYALYAQSEDSAGLKGNIYKHLIIITQNAAPSYLGATNDRTEITQGQDLVLTDIVAKDSDGWRDVSRVDFWMETNSGLAYDLKDINRDSFEQWNGDPDWAIARKFVFTYDELQKPSPGSFTLYGKLYDSEGQSIRGSETLLKYEYTVLPANASPGSLIIADLPDRHAINTPLTIDPIRAYDPDGYKDIAKIDFWLTTPKDDSVRIEIDDITFFEKTTEEGWATSRPVEIPASTFVNLSPGEYFLQAQAYDKSGNPGEIFKHSIVLYKPYDDAYELNNTKDSPCDLTLFKNTPLSRISGPAKQGDEDWYAFIVEKGQEQLEITTSFVQSEGDIDIALYSENFSLIKESVSTRDAETIETLVPKYGRYLLQVKGKNRGNSYDLIWNSSPPITMANDNFSNRTILTGASVTSQVSNVNFGGETGEPTQEGVVNSAWWTWIAPSNGSTEIYTDGSNFDTYLSVYTGSSLNRLTLIGANDDNTVSLANHSAGTSRLSFNAQRGERYHIAVDGYADETGDIVLNIRQSNQEAISNTGKATFSIKGLAEVGAELQIKRTESDPEGDGEFQVEWEIKESVLSEEWLPFASGDTLFLGNELEGQSVRAKVSYIDNQGYPELVYLNALQIPFVNDGTGRFRIEGAPLVGEKLSMREVYPDPDGSHAYSIFWETSANGKEWVIVESATEFEYVIGNGLQDQFVRFTLNYLDHQRFQEKFVSDAILIKTPTSLISTMSDTVAEGEKLVLDVQTDGLPQDSIIYIEFSGEGINPDDFSSPSQALVESAKIQEDGKVSFVRQIANDKKFEGTEYVEASIFRDESRKVRLSSTAKIKIPDTSVPDLITEWNLDLDKSGRVTTEDSLVVMRHMLGTFVGDSLSNGLKDASLIKADRIREEASKGWRKYEGLFDGLPPLDLDGNLGRVEALSDGLILSAYLNDASWDKSNSNFTELIGISATRSNTEKIIEHLRPITGL